MPSAELRIAEEFSAALAEIFSTRVLSRIESAVRGLVSGAASSSNTGAIYDRFPSLPFWSCIATTGKRLTFLPLSTDLLLFDSI